MLGLSFGLVAVQVLLVAQLSLQAQHFVLFETTVLPCSTSWSRTLDYLLASVFPSAGITAMSHHGQLHLEFFKKNYVL